VGLLITAYVAKLLTAAEPKPTTGESGTRQSARAALDLEKPNLED